MKFYRSATLRALSILLIGALIIAFPTNATKYLVIIIGALFFLPGVISLASFYWHKKKQKTEDERLRAEGIAMTAADAKKNGKAKGSELFPIIGAGSVLFGIILMLFPASFQNVLLYILGAFLIVAAIAQAINLYKLSKVYRINFVPFIASAVTGIAGIVIIILNHSADAPAPADASTTASTYTPALIFGIGSVIYGISELLCAIYFRKPAPKASEATQPAETPKTSAAPSKVGEYVEAEIVED